MKGYDALLMSIKGCPDDVIVLHQHCHNVVLMTYAYWVEK